MKNNSFHYKCTCLIRTILPLFVLMLLKTNTIAQNKSVHELKIIPEPVNVVCKSGNFRLDSLTQLVNAENKPEITRLCAFLNQKLRQAAGYSLLITKIQTTHHAIVFNLDSTIHFHPEGYFITVTSQTTTIKAKTCQGLFYGLQTFFQLLPPQIESKQSNNSVDWQIPCLEINDYPRFQYRGMHLDVSRHFYSVDFIKKQLDIMALYKLNIFHWHLTDDQGWRIEIKKYPKLTEIGSQRKEPDGTSYGGYYTQEQIKDIVKYAMERYIQVLPEIEMPGHAMAALSAYPENSCIGGPFQVPNTWGGEIEAFCPGKEQTFAFLDGILAEISQLFPYAYIHIGGDECLKDRWKVCPFCQARMKEQGLKNVKQLQSYFIKRIETIVQSHGKRIIGWDEILEGGLAPNATVMSWQDEKGGIAAATQHHDVIMCPQKWLYFDHYQGSEKVEPVALKGLVTLKDVYNYNPVSRKLQPELQKFIIGVQANIWSEYLYSPEKVEYIAYPRMLALSEMAWSPVQNKDFNGFLERLNNQFQRLDYLEIHYHIPLPEGPVNVEAFTDTLTLSFTASRKVNMVYTLDGRDPDQQSASYRQPFLLHESTLIKIRSVLPTGEMSAVRMIYAQKETFARSQTMDTKPGLLIKSTPGIYFSVKDLDTVTHWSNRIIYNLKTRFDANFPSASIITGYMDIPKNGIYYFSTNVEQCWINADLLINNNGEVKNHSRNDASVALMKGKHAIKLIFLNNIVGGRPSAINGIRLFYRCKTDSKPRLVDAAMLSH